MPNGANMPKKAMVLAAGLGLRMRPITNTTPKPMLEVAGRTLVDRTIDRFEEIGVEAVVVNLHHLGDRIENHLKQRSTPEILFSHEEDRLETGGGVKKALDNFGNEPFWIANTDVMFLHGSQNALHRMAEQWDPDKMDGLLMVHSTVEAYGYQGKGDFVLDPLGRLERRDEREVSPYLFTGVQILKPEVFEGCPEGAFSLNVIYDKLIEQERLFGIAHDGEWFHVGTPDGLNEAESFMRERWAGAKHR